MAWLEIDSGVSDNVNTVVNTYDQSFTLKDGDDPTKALQFQLSGLTTGTTRTLTVPDANTTLVGRDTTDTLTNKTLSAGTLTGATTLPGSGEIGSTGNIAIGRATADKIGLWVARTLGAGSDSAGVQVSPTFHASAASSAYGISVAQASAAGSYTITNSIGLRLHDGFAGAGSTWTNYYALYIDEPTVASTTNRAIYVLGGTSEFAGNSIVTAANGYREHGRTLPMGEWAGVNNGVEFGGYTFNAADFTGSASMTWTVALADIIAFMYTIIGNTMIIIFELEQTSVGGTPDTQLKFKIPASKVALAETYGWARLNDNGGAVAAGQCATFTAGGGDTYVSVTKVPLANWTAATNTTNVAGQIIMPIQA